MKIKQIKDEVVLVEMDFKTLAHVVKSLGVEIDEDDKRTLQQNRALHKYFALLSEALNDSGLTPVRVLKIDVMWTPTSVKEYLWRPVQKAVLKKKSTTALKKDEIDKVYDVLNLAISQKFKISIPFPNRDEV